MEMPVLTGGVQIPEYPGDHFHYVFSKILMAGRANGLQVIDGPYLKIREPEGFRDYCKRTRILGYDGKWALHPDQVDDPERGVLADPGAVRQGVGHPRGLREGDDRGRGKGAVMFGDEMIDEASRKMAIKFVSRGERAGFTRSPAAQPRWPRSIEAAGDDLEAERLVGALEDRQHAGVDVRAADRDTPPRSHSRRGSAGPRAVTHSAALHT